MYMTTSKKLVAKKVGIRTIQYTQENMKVDKKLKILCDYKVLFKVNLSVTDALSVILHEAN